MHCPHCRHPLQVRVEYLGRRVNCRFCHSSFRVQTVFGEGSGSGEIPVVPSGEFAAVDGDPGPAIAGYEPLGLIRDGAMGRVYKARQTCVDRLVAVKVLHREFAAKAEYVARFHREATFAARLSHTNIPHLLDAGEVQGCPYLVMDFAEGRTAQDRLDSHGAFPEPVAVSVALDAARALEHVHQHGLIHRDVKPSNLILTPDRGARLIDFGLARSLHDEAWATAEAGNTIGTPVYISPEQTRGQSDLDPRSDLYSLGSTLYHLVTGRPPYTGTSQEIIRQHADPRLRPVEPARINPTLSPAIGAVITRLTAKNRDARYQGAGALIDDLRRVRRGEAPLCPGHSAAENPG
jgi:serine/threonine-protein kinase